MKKAAAVCMALLAMALCACGSTGEPDRTGSWGQINQVIKRPDNWQKIVMDDSFSLGKRTLVEGAEGSDDYYFMEYGTYPNIDGSTVCVPLAVEFARQHLGMSDEEACGFVVFNTTDVAYEYLINKEGWANWNEATNTVMEEKPVDIILVTEPSDDELALAAQKGVELVAKPICYDAFVFITHKDNPVDNLSVEQIQKIYTGEITNWKEVGGNDQPIRAFQREENSGSQTTMEKQVMKGKKMLPPDKIEIVTGMGELLEVVGEYQNSGASLGYTFKYYIDTLYKAENVKTLSVNGVAPTAENIRSGAYPFTTHYFGVIRSEDKEKAGGKFLNWMLTEAGQKCIKQAGYIPIAGQ